MSRAFLHQLSLLFNVVLAVTVIVLVFRGVHRAPSHDEVGAAIEVEPESAPNEKTVLIHPAAPPQYPDIPSASGRRRWLVDQLRAAGVPNDVLARVVLSDLDEDFQSRFDELAEQGKGDADSMTALQLEQDMGRDAEMRAALGEDGYKQWDRRNMLGEANVGKIQLTESEADALYDLKKKLQQRQWDLERARSKGEMDEAEISDASDKAYSEFNRQMKALLGTERYAQSQGLDEGTLATNLRQDLAKVNPSDSQFQALFTAQQQWNERRSELDKQFQSDQSSLAYAQQIKAMDEAREQEYLRVLGTNIFDTFQKQQDGAYSKMKKYEKVWGLDDASIDYVYGTLKFYEKSVQDYQARARALDAQSQNVDWDAVNKTLQEFAQQIQQSLQSYLGEDRISKMQRNGLFQFNQLTQRGSTL